MTRSLWLATLARCTVRGAFSLLVLGNALLSAQTNTFQVTGGQPWIDVTGQGAYLDAQTSCFASATSLGGGSYTIALTQGSFGAPFIGEEMWVQGSTVVPAVGSAPAVGTITAVATASSVTFTASSGTVPNASGGLCVTWGHDDVYALQASLNLLTTPPFNGVGGEIKIPHGKTGLMMVGQQQAAFSQDNQSGTAGVVVLTVSTPSSVWPSNVFQSAAGATITITCTGRATPPSMGGGWNGSTTSPYIATESVTGWDPRAKSHSTSTTRREPRRFPFALRAP